MEEICLGIDWGEARIGLAVGDTASKVASPFVTVASLEEVIKVIEQEGIDRVVMGNPVQMSGRASSATFTDFLNRLKARVSVPVELVDERLSSALADRLDAVGRKEGRRDAIAAMVILQSYFDRPDPVA